MLQFMITFNHVEGAWERLSPEDREAHGKWLVGSNEVRQIFSPPD